MAEGAPPDAMLEARHVGSTIVAMRAPLGQAALWSVAERDRGGLRRAAWRPPETGPRPSRG